MQPNENYMYEQETEHRRVRKKIIIFILFIIISSLIVNSVLKSIKQQRLKQQDPYGLSGTWSLDTYASDNYIFPSSFTFQSTTSWLRMLQQPNNPTQPQNIYGYDLDDYNYVMDTVKLCKVDSDTIIIRNLKAGILSSDHTMVYNYSIEDDILTLEYTNNYQGYYDDIYLDGEIIQAEYIKN